MKLLSAAAVAALAVFAMLDPAPVNAAESCSFGNRTSTFLKGRWELPGLPVDVYDRFAYWLGTSFAAPHVAGRIAATMTERGLSAVAARDALLVGKPEFFPGYGVLVG